MMVRVLKWTLMAVAISAGAVATLLGTGVLMAIQQGARTVNADQAFENRLFIPPILEARQEEGLLHFQLDVRDASHSFLAGLQTPTKSYGLDYLGPTIRVRTGDRVRIDVRNKLQDSTTVHWHGMILPAAVDGGPHQAIPPGGVWRAEWEVLNEAATYWYHPHSMHRTGKEVYDGLAGLFIVDDDASERLTLPSDYGETDIPLVLQDRSFNEDGSFAYEADPRDRLGRPGMLGDTILVNGTIGPYVELPRSVVRFRVVNGSNARRYNLAFSDGRSFHQIATDGGLLEAPVELDQLTLAPGERAEILVDLSADAEPVTLMSRAIFDQNFIFTGGKTILGATRDENQTFDLLEIRPTLASLIAADIPAALRELPEIEHLRQSVDFHVQLAENWINGRVMEHSRIDHVSAAGTFEVWEIEALDMPHPFHIHGVQFRVLSRNGQRPPPNERGWKDTVLVHQNERVRILIPMPPYADGQIPFMFHCHILEHEDAGMMGQFLVVDEKGDKIGISRSPNRLEYRKGSSGAFSPEHHRSQHH